MFRFLPRIVAIFLLAILTLLITNRFPTNAASDHIVISEVMNSGSNEFVELFNPTNTSVNLSGWFITRKNTEGSSETNFLASGLIGNIPAHGYFLIANRNSSASSSADIIYTTGFTENSTITLYSDNKITTVDKVGLGTASDKETNNIPNPNSNQSIERKAGSLSTSISMGIGGADEFMGNGEDTNNNANDFVLRNVPQPQNSLSVPEPVPTATPSDTPTPTTISSPTPTETLTPTQQPTSIPSPTPTVTISPTPTDPLPTNILSITPSAIPSISISPTPSITPTTHPIFFPRLKFVCTIHKKTVSIFFKHFDIQIPSCHIEKH